MSTQALRRTLSIRTSLICSLLLALACENAQPDPPARAASPPPAPAAETEVTIFAAASLKAAFESLGAGFEASHPGAEVQFNFAGTQEIRRQLEHGAQADVIAAADEKHMQALLAQQLVLLPQVFAENEPVLAVYAQAKRPITALADLANADRLVFGVPEVPIGRYTSEILAKAEQAYGQSYRKRVESRVVSRELNVRQVLAKVTLGEADAAIVYRSDVTPPRPELRVVDIPKELNVVARYPIAVVKNSQHAQLARAWLELVRSAQGQQALRQAGFRPLDGS